MSKMGEFYEEMRETHNWDEADEYYSISAPSVCAYCGILCSDDDEVWIARDVMHTGCAIPYLKGNKEEYLCNSHGYNYDILKVNDDGTLMLGSAGGHAEQGDISKDIIIER